MSLLSHLYILPVDALVSPGPVDREAEQVDGEECRLKVGREKRLLEMEVVKDVLGELGGRNPDDIDDEEDKNSHRQSLRTRPGVGGGPPAL